MTTVTSTASVTPKWKTECGHVLESSVISQIFANCDFTCPECKFQIREFRGFSEPSSFFLPTTELARVGKKYQYQGEGCAREEWSIKFVSKNLHSAVKDVDLHIFIPDMFISDEVTYPTYRFSVVFNDRNTQDTYHALLQKRIDKPVTLTLFMKQVYFDTENREAYFSLVNEIFTRLILDETDKKTYEEELADEAANYEDWQHYKQKIEER